METVRVSRNPTTVVTVNGKVQTNEEATVYVRDLNLFVTAQLLGGTSSFAWKALRRTDISVSGPVVKNHIVSKTAEGYHPTRKTACLCPGFANTVFQFKYGRYVLNNFIAGLDAGEFYAGTSKDMEWAQEPEGPGRLET